MSIDKIQENLKYYTLLSEKYPTIQEAATEIINLQAILNLPKGTEHFMSDLHGEYESFLHILKNGSGVIRRKIDDIFKNTITDAERKKISVPGLLSGTKAGTAERGRGQPQGFL